MIIYKICPQTHWEKARLSGVFEGLPVDTADGFMHFSTKEQVPGTLARHFNGQTDLVIAELDLAKLPKDLAEKVKWEGRSKDNLYPHIYTKALPFRVFDSARKA